MRKKYIKLALLFYIPVLLTALYRAAGTMNWRYGVTVSSSQFGNIQHPAIPNFSGDFGIVVLFLCLATGLLSLFVFSELRSQNIGGFITSLPVKKSVVYTWIFISGCLLISLTYATIYVLFINRFQQGCAEAYAVFATHGWPDLGEELVNQERMRNTAWFFRSFAVVTCLYGVLTFVQALFQKPAAALCATIGGLGGMFLCLMTLDKYLIVSGYGGISTWFNGERGSFRHFYLRFFYDDTPTILIHDMILLGSVTAIFFAAGLYLYKKSGRYGDFIFSFPAVKIIMITGITVCSGCLSVYALFLQVGMSGLRLGTMNTLFASVAFFAFALSRKLFHTIC